MRPNLWAFANQSAVDIGYAKSQLRGQCAGMAQKNLAGCAFPLWITGRKVTPNVALRQGPVNGVRDRMHGHIRVRVSNQPLVIRHIHAAQGHVVARPEGMHVKSVAQANVHCGAPEYVPHGQNPRDR